MVSTATVADTSEGCWSQVCGYTDCNSELRCNNTISTLTNIGIIDGFSDGIFRPYAQITRAQFAKIAMSFFENTPEDYQGLLHRREHRHLVHGPLCHRR